MKLKYYFPALVILGCGIAIYFMSQARGQGSPRVRPATITYQRVFFRSSVDQPPRFTLTEILGVRSDGSTSRVRLIPPANGAPQRYNLKIADISASRLTIVDAITRSKTTYPAANVVAQYTVKPANSCAGNQGDRILGYATMMEDENRSVEAPVTAAATSRIRVWRAPDLNCLPLREEHWWIDSSNKETLSMVVTATIVMPGEPATWMFDIPADYTERSPGEVFRQNSITRGTPQQPSPTGLDEIYSDSQPTTGKQN